MYFLSKNTYKHLGLKNKIIGKMSFKKILQILLQIIIYNYYYFKIIIFNRIRQQIFPARAPNSEIEISEMRDNYGISPGLNRTAYQQAGYQLLALAVTLGISIVSGLITGTFNQSARRIL